MTEQTPVPRLAKIVGLIAFAALLAYTYVYAYRIPYADHWDQVGFMWRRDAGTYDFSDLFNLHDAHWHASGYIINNTLTALFGFSPLNEALTSVALGGVAALIALPMATRFAPGRYRPAIAASLAAILILSLDQASNWLWGWQTAVIITVLGSIAFTVAASGPRFGWLQLVVMMAGAAVSIYGFATAFSLLPLGLALLIYRKNRARKIEPVSLHQIIAWAGFCGLILFHYGVSYSAKMARGVPGIEDTGPTSLFETVSTIALFVPAFIGAGLSGGTDTAAFIALLLALPCFGLMVVRSRQNGDQIEDLLPALVLMAIGLGAAALASLGRTEFGHTQGLVARYVTFSSLFWLGAGLWLVRVFPSPATAWRHGGLLGRVALGALVILTTAKAENIVRASKQGATLSREIAVSAETLRAAYPDIPRPAMRKLERGKNVRRDRKDITFLYERGWPPFDRTAELPAAAD